MERTGFQQRPETILLLKKAESFVSRRVVKARDAFDYPPLLQGKQGATLDQGIESPPDANAVWGARER